jgi:hypothetical protein
MLMQRHSDPLLGRVTVSVAALQRVSPEADIQRGKNCRYPDRSFAARPYDVRQKDETSFRCMAEDQLVISDRSAVLAFLRSLFIAFVMQALQLSNGLREVCRNGVRTGQINRLTVEARQSS